MKKNKNILIVNSEDNPGLCEIFNKIPYVIIKKNHMDYNKMLKKFIPDIVIVIYYKNYFLNECLKKCIIKNRIPVILIVKDKLISNIKLEYDYIFSDTVNEIELLKNISSILDLKRKYDSQFFKIKKLRKNIVQNEKDKILYNYNERVKELNCLYNISKAVDKYDSLDDLLQSICNIIPPGWQYPDITCACIKNGNLKYCSKSCRKTKWTQKADIKINNKKIGEINICYSQKKKILDEGPFLKEERYLLNTIAERLSKIIQRHQSLELLKENEERFKNIVENINEGIWIIDDKMNTVFINDNMVKILKYKKEDIIGKNFLQFMNINKEKNKNIINNIINYKNKNVFDAILNDCNNDKIYVSICASPFYDPANKITAVIMGFIDITEKTRAINNLNKSKEELKILTAHIQYIREKERKNISKEIHDELGQILTALKMEVLWVVKKTDDDKNVFLEKSKSILDLIDTAIKSIQRISAELRPRLLDDFGLIAAIEWQIKEFTERTGIKCEVKSLPEEINIQQDASIAIFRIFQELLTNIARHSKASVVKIYLKIIKKYLLIEVFDNGSGMNKEELNNPSSIGLIGIKERINYLGGILDIYSKKNKGTSFNAMIPLERWEL